jgi:hypothetical protein
MAAGSRRPGRGPATVSSLIRGFEADPDRSAALSAAIFDAMSPSLDCWALTLEMRFAGAGDESVTNRLRSGLVQPVAASGRGLGGGELWVEEIADVDAAERAELDAVLMPVYLADQLRLSWAQANAAALRLAAHRIAAPDLPGADLAARLGDVRARPGRYYAARWHVFILAVSRVQAGRIARMLATTIVDQAGRPRGRVVDLDRIGFDYEYEAPDDWDPDELIEQLADHAANAAALKSPAMLAGALLTRAWQVEAREHESAMMQRVRDLLGHPDRKLVGPDELRDAELRAELISRGRSAADLRALARRTRHLGHQYGKGWTVDIDDHRRDLLAAHEADAMLELAQALEGAQAPDGAPAMPEGPGPDIAARSPSP